MERSSFGKFSEFILFFYDWFYEEMLVEQPKYRIFVFQQQDSLSLVETREESPGNTEHHIS